MSECVAEKPLDEIPCPVHGTLAHCPLPMPTEMNLRNVWRILTASRRIEVHAGPPPPSSDSIPHPHETPP